MSVIKNQQQPNPGFQELSQVEATAISAGCNEPHVSFKFHWLLLAMLAQKYSK